MSIGDYFNNIVYPIYKVIIKIIYNGTYNNKIIVI